jgi:hypothetical protein
VAALSYYGGRLSPLFQGPSIDRLCRDMAEHGGRDMVANVRRNTPVGHQPFTEDYVPGALRASIEKKILVVYRRANAMVYESGAETNLLYAPFVEDGTGLWGPHRAKYEIKPRNPDGWLSWIDQETGKRLFAKKVMHPGSPGNHMFAIGAALTEHEFANWGQREVAAWARKVERDWANQRPVFIGRRVA